MNPEPITVESSTSEALTAQGARELTDRIKSHVEQAWELIKQAYAARAWIPLNYGSWDDYCAAEFDRARIRIPREERTEIVVSLRDIGMSTRAIAAATGMAKGTVRKELGQVGQIDPPDAVTGVDGKTYPLKPTDREPIPSEEPVGFFVLEELESGADKSAPSRRRAPLTESFDTARRDLLKDVQRLERLADDDRFDRRASQLAHQHRSDLIRARDALQGVIDRLPDTTNHPEER
ncbi:hypothetical protein [Nocardia terpenica]|uniref:Uncharacterized protein n=1 Tax=Nocardia terpenica TaxID=455432 RepID=A0A164MF12_9NOCA|nr:hypothetical protein [Nocardia terpenica]KZM73301.1 hypothetical protein AWN90_32075 [Nocardia terpenica]NQE87549.1 hypothetical protein [Nocardia terpenica]